MPTSTFRFGRAILIAVLGGMLGPLSAEPEALEAVNEPGASEQTAADLLECVGKNTRARWRLLFRPPPPTPPMDRGRAALILGTLMGDSFLIWQAGDAQQFRNNNQDVLAYCRTLGLGEKLLPRLMTQGNLAEQNGWRELRQEIVDGHQEAMRLLREQMDEDLALMIDIGVGLRVFEIVSNLITAAPENGLVLYEGSPELLRDLREDFNRISATKREEALLQRVRSVIDESCLAWQEVHKAPLTNEQLVKTNDTLHALMEALVTK